MCAAGCVAGRAAGRAAGCVVHAPKIHAPSGLRCVVARVATRVAGRAVRCAANRGVRRPKNSRAVGVGGVCGAQKIAAPSEAVGRVKKKSRRRGGGRVRGGRQNGVGRVGASGMAHPQKALRRLGGRGGWRWLAVTASGLFGDGGPWGLCGSAEGRRRAEHRGTGGTGATPAGQAGTRATAGRRQAAPDP